jgi:transposase
MLQYSRYVGFDVHKESVVVSVAEQGIDEPRFYGEIPNTRRAVEKLVRKLSPHGEVIAFCYEAGPCGYGIYRQITGLGHDCVVVAPSLIPKKPGDRVKTDRRDSRSLAGLFRSGELTAVWVPDQEQEAKRDLTRAREDMKALGRQSRQRLGAFLLRHDRVYCGQSKWTQAHFRWLEGLKFERPIQQIVFQEYVDTVKYCQGRVASLEREMETALESWSLGPVVKALMALRGFKLVAAMTVIAELGDLSRFESPSDLMGYLGLVPSEHTSGSKRRQGGITKTGNGHVRRILVESAWSYRFPARKTAHLQRKAENSSEGVQAIAWKAQKRLCKRYRHLVGRNKLHVEACTAVARELAGFVWAIAREVLAERVGGVSALARA